MAQTGFTPILIYASGTPTNTPLAANLTSSASGAELALNYADGKLFYKDSGGVVQLLASKASATGTVSSVDVSGGTTGLTTSGGPVTTSGTITLAGTLATTNGGTGLTAFTSGGAVYATSTSALTTGTLPTTAGGTGLASFTAGDITYYATGTALSKLAIGTSGQVLTSTGSAPQWSTLSGVAVTTISFGTTGLTPNSGTSGAVTVAGTLVAANGGTGQSTYTTGDLLYASGATALSKLGIGTSNYILTSSGSAPQWTQYIGVAQGGTGLTSGTSGGVLYFSATGTLASSAALTANAIVLGGGAGVAPSTTTTGTGVVTAIGNSVNTTGGLVTQSGTLTASALLLGGGSGTAISSTTTGTGVVTALGNNADATGGFTTTNGAATLTNKRIDPRVSSTTSTASVTPTIASYDMYAFTAQAATLTINAPTGTPVDGDKLMFRILDNGVSQTLSWNATYTAIGVTIPTATTANKMTYVGCIYNAANTRWDVVAVTTQS